MTPYKAITSSYYKAFFALLVIAVSVVPAFVYSTYTITGDFINSFKYYSFLIACAFCFFFLACVLFLKRSWPERISTIINIPGLIFSLWITFTILNALRLGANIGDKDVVKLMTLFGLFLLTRFAFHQNTSRKVNNIFSSVLLFSALIESLIGELQWLGFLRPLNLHFPITGTFKNPAPFALYLSAAFPISLSIILDSKFKWSSPVKVVAYLSAISTILILPCTEIRSAWIAVIAGASVVLYFRYNLSSRMRSKLTTLKQKAAAIVVLASISIVAIFGLYRLKPLSSAGRSLIWKISYSKFRERAIMGYGYSSFRKSYNLWQAEYFMADSNKLKVKELYTDKSASYLAGNVETAYNEYLEIAVESGLIGLVLFLGTFATAIYLKAAGSNVAEDSFILGSLGGLISILAAATFSYPFKSLPTFCLFITFLAIISDSAISQSVTVRTLPLVKTFAAFIFALGGLLLVKISVTVFSYGEWKAAKSLEMAGNCLGAEQQYSSQYPYLRDDPFFLVDFSQCLAETGNPDSAIALLSKAKSLTSNPELYIASGQVFESTGQTSSALSDYRLAHYMTPGRLYPLYLLAENYASRRDTTSALYYANQLLRTPAKVESGNSDWLIHETNNLIQKLMHLN